MVTAGFVDTFTVYLSEFFPGITSLTSTMDGVVIGGSIVIFGIGESPLALHLGLGQIL